MKRTIFFIYFVHFIVNTNASLLLKIIGGEDTDITLHRYQASLRVRGKHFCGGIIVGRKHILTAAHCFTAKLHKRIVPPYVDVSIHTGTSSSREIGHIHRIATVKLHSEWKMETISANDISVVTLADQISFDASQQMAELPEHDVVSGTTAYLTGWGCTSLEKSAKTTVQLQKLRMTILTNVDCQSQLPIRIQESELCAYHSKGHGCCSGDSGGPLAVDNQVIGILSWVHNGNCASGIPEVYTNLYAHRSFIQSSLNI